MQETPSCDASEGVQTHTENTRPQQEDDGGWITQQELDSGAPSPMLAAQPGKKKNRAGYWKELKARKKALVAADGDNENGGVATTPMIVATPMIIEDDSVKENVDVEDPTPVTPVEPKSKGKGGKKAKKSEHAVAEVTWQSSATCNDNSAWDESVTQKIWDIENRNGQNLDGNDGTNQIAQDGANESATKKKKKKKAKSKAVSEPASENLATGANADPIGTRPEREVPPAVQESEILPVAVKDKKKPKKKKGKKVEANTLQGNTLLAAPGSSGVDAIEELTPASSVAGAYINGVSTNEPEENNHAIGSHDVEAPIPETSHFTSFTVTNEEKPIEKPKQMKIQVDLDLELAASLKAKVKGEMMITFL